MTIKAEIQEHDIVLGDKKNLTWIIREDVQALHTVLIPDM